MVLRVKVEHNLKLQSGSPCIEVNRRQTFQDLCRFAASSVPSENLWYAGVTEVLVVSYLRCSIQRESVSASFYIKSYYYSRSCKISERRGLHASRFWKNCNSFFCLLIRIMWPTSALKYPKPLSSIQDPCRWNHWWKLYTYRRPRYWSKGPESHQPGLDAHLFELDTYHCHRGDNGGNSITA